MTANYNQRMYEIFRAILALMKEDKYPVSTRIVEQTGRNIHHVTRNLRYYYHWGYLSKNPTNGRRQKTVGGCIWYYTLTKRGRDKYKELTAEFETNN